MAVALFSFPSLAAYETYRQQILTDEECQAAFAFAETTRCIFSYERTFLHPIFGDGDDGGSGEGFFPCLTTRGAAFAPFPAMISRR
jgi:hypothetical protein